MARRGAFYEAFGEMRGPCGHEHRTPPGAVDCVHMDRAEFPESDRLVYVTDPGEPRRRLWPQGEV